jgi:outer membrane protein OmpA-like peptidoglycan-associated protein
MESLRDSWRLNVVVPVLNVAQKGDTSMNNFYFTPVMLPLVAVAGVGSSWLKQKTASKPTGACAQQSIHGTSGIDDEQSQAVQLLAQLADLNVVSSSRGTVVTLSNELFGTDLAPINPDGMRIMQKLAFVLQQHQQYSVLIEGFSDDAGTASYNQELSERRSLAVRNALQELGVERARVTIRGYGDTFPVVPNDTPHNRKLNRRVEISLFDSKNKIKPR